MTFTPRKGHQSNSYIRVTVQGPYYERAQMICENTDLTLRELGAMAFEYALDHMEENDDV